MGGHKEGVLYALYPFGSGGGGFVDSDFFPLQLARAQEGNGL